MTKPLRPSPAATLLWTRLGRLPARILIALVRGYQLLFSPLIGPNCRYQPTCSNYMIQAIRNYGAISGALRGVRRICRCHPLSRGGYDPP